MNDKLACRNKKYCTFYQKYNWKGQLLTPRYVVKKPIKRRKQIVSCDEKRLQWENDTKGIFILFFFKRTGAYSSIVTFSPLEGSLQQQNMSRNIKLLFWKDQLEKQLLLMIHIYSTSLVFLKAHFLPLPQQWQGIFNFNSTGFIVKITLTSHFSWFSSPTFLLFSTLYILFS